MLQLHHPQVSLRLVVVERHLKVCHKPQHIFPMWYSPVEANSKESIRDSDFTAYYATGLVKFRTLRNLKPRPGRQVASKS